MNRFYLKILFACLLVGCVQFQPISIYDAYPVDSMQGKERIFFNESKGTLWSNFGSCATLEIVSHQDENNVILLDWNKTQCDWVGLGNSWSSFMADDISEIVDSAAITFRVKAFEGSQKSVPFVIGLEDYSGGSSYVFSHLNLYADDLEVSSDKWTNFYIPLSNYDFSMQGVDVYGIKQMIIQLEGSGKVFLDDIKLISFTNDQYISLRNDVELLKPIANPNQDIFPGEFDNMAWGLGQTNCQNLQVNNNVIKWQWNNCTEWKKWGINWTDWYAFNLRGVVDKSILSINVSKEHDLFFVAIEDFKGKRKSLPIENYSASIVNDSIVSYQIPLYDFQLIENNFTLDQMKQLEFTGKDSGVLSIYEIKLFEK